MGYINDTGEPGPPYICHDLYKWLLRVDPKYDTDDDNLCRIVRNEEADVELWQYMGRRFFPLPPPNDQWVRPPHTEADYSRPRVGYVRGVASLRTQYSFATQVLRDRVAARLVVEGYRVTDKWKEPTT
jgi:hypothetical protein